MKKIVRCISLIGMLACVLALIFFCLPHFHDPVLRFRKVIYEIETQGDATIYTHELNRITQTRNGNTQTLAFDLAWLSKRTYMVSILGSRVRVADADGTVLLSGEMRCGTLYNADGTENIEYSQRLKQSSTGNTMYEANSKLPPSAVEALALAQGRFDSTRKFDSPHVSELTCLFALCILALRLTAKPQRGVLFIFLEKSRK